MSLSKEVKLYRINKVYNSLREHTTLDDISRLECVIEEILRVLESLVEDN